MGRSQFNSWLFQIRLWIFEVCETVIFIVLVVALAIYSIRHIIEFGSHH